MESVPQQPDSPATVQSWEQGAPWHRRFSARTGLQGKLVIGFMAMLLGALGGSCWLFVSESRKVLELLAGEQVMETSNALGMASETPLAKGDAAELGRIGRNLLKNRELIAVAFFDGYGRLLTISSRDPGNRWPDGGLLPDPRMDPSQLMHVSRGFMPAAGPYVQVTSPVLTVSPAGPLSSITRQGAATRLAGYVSVCLSQADNEAGIRYAKQTLLLMGAVTMLVAWPMIYALVYRIFEPIRQLVRAADRIAAGDLDTEVAIHRSDMIGTLARSFNEMARRVRGQQAALEEANRDLEAKVRQRTEQLEAANQRLQREGAEKEDFLRAVSHDLGAPLRNIDGIASMLLLKHREHFDEDVIHRLERIQKNVEVETSLISELLELSRIKTRRQQVELVDIGALATEVGGIFESDLRTRDIRLVIDTPLPVLRCERSRLRQVFQNLIDNAIKYMGEGSASAEGATVREIHMGAVLWADEAEFYVRDTGTGIEPADLDKVFCIFRRGKSAVARGVAGKGVGLASVKSIIETYNGKIWVESEVGRGSTFRFTISGQYVPALAKGDETHQEDDRQQVPADTEAETDAAVRED